MTRRLRPFVVFAFFVIAFSLGPVLSSRDAAACINVTRAELDKHVRLVQSAEAALTGGNPARARAILDAQHHIRMIMSIGAAPLASDLTKTEIDQDQALVQRMRRIWALATVRMNPRRTTPGSAATDDFFVAEGLITRALEDAKTGGATPEPSLVADYAEVMASSGFDAVAAPYLRWLAVGDLMGNAHAYAHLARIESADGNTEAATLARDRCKRMAKQPSICRR